MENAFEVPIGADLSPLLKAMNELAASMRELSGSMNQALAPARKALGDLGKSTQAAGQQALKSSGGFREIGKSAFTTAAAVASLGASVASIVSAVPRMVQVFRVLGPVVGRAMGGIRGGFSALGVQLRSVASHPAFRKIALGAAAAAVAIGGMVVAVKTVRFAFRSLQTVVRYKFNRMVNSARTAAALISGAFRGLKNMIPGFGGGGMLGPMAGLLGAGAGIALLVSQLKTGSTLAGEFERSEVALASLTGSLDTARSMIAEMKDTWEKTGVAFSDQAANVQKFVALGFSSDQALQLGHNILDVSGALGLTQREAVLLGSALAQVKAKGVVAMEELRQQIAEKGVPVFEALSSAMGVSQGKLIDMVSKGEVGADRLLSIFLNLEGSFARFKGGAENFGRTWLGMLARLKAASQVKLAEFMAPINAALKPVVSEVIERLGAMKDAFRRAGETVGKVILTAFAMFKSGQTLKLFGLGLRIAFLGAMDILNRGLRATVAFLASALPPIFDVLFEKLRNPHLWHGIGKLLSGYGKMLASQLYKVLAEIYEVLPGFGNNNRAQKTRDEAEEKRTEGLSDLYRAGGHFISLDKAGSDFGQVIAEALVNAGQAAKSAASGPQSLGLKSAINEFREAGQSLKILMDDLVSRNAVKIPAAPPTASGSADEETSGGKGEILSVVSSLRRIGGGGGGFVIAPMVTQQQRTNTLLTAIHQKIGQSSAPAVAAYA